MRQNIFSLLSMTFILLVTAITPINVKAEPIDFFKIDGVQYNNAITTPDAFIGYGLGDKPVRHDILVGYLRSLARQSPRIQVETIGASHEGRPILAFTISSPDNLARIDDIKKAHKDRLTNASATNDGPVVVWLNYGVHGAESSGMDASIPTLYHLAAAEGEAIEQMLEETVVIIIAVFNPDGHSRRVNHVFTFNGSQAVTDPNHDAHNLWLGARTNHYWFDLNRDWLLLTQPESQAWIKVWHDWKPNVSADFHEMGSDSSYYFHPGEPRRKNPLIPERERELLLAISEEHANWLDEKGELYTSEEGFDNFYIGKGSTYPSINGGIGILFEAAAARGGTIETENGIRTYSKNINIHFNTSLTTIAGARKNSAAILDYQRSFFTRAERAARADNKKAYVFKTHNDAVRTDRFVNLLNQHDIEVYKLKQTLILNEQNFDKDDSFVVPLNQAQYTMIKGIFDRVTEFEESIFYDVSGWTLPLAYDLDYQVIEGLRFNSSLLGERVSGYTPQITAPEKASYGYAFSWNPYYAPRLLKRFMDAGALPRVIMQPKTITQGDNTITLERGSIFVPVNSQITQANKIDANRLHEIALEGSTKDRIEVFALNSGNIQPGVGDLGSINSVRTIRKPKILVLYNTPGNYSAGQLWHLIDYKMNMPVTLRRVSDLQQLALKEYTHIIMPDGSSTSQKPAIDSLKRWIRQGGTLMTTKRASSWAQNALMDKVEKEDVKKKEDKTKNEKVEKPTRIPYAEKNLRDAEHLIGGAIFGSELDITHPLGFGFGDKNIATMRAGTAVLKRPKDPYAVVAQYNSAPVLSGYASERRQKELGATPMLIANRMGQGSLILFADDPAFRATFPGTDKLVMNAIFFGDLFAPARLP